MLNPLIRWEPGTLVRYHGSLTDLSGSYRAYPCDCLRCDDPILGTPRFRLADASGKTVATCVRARSITPAFEETPAQAGRADRDYWVDRDWDGEPDDPSDHYNY
jgi:hypothetical protein